MTWTANTSDSEAARRAGGRRWYNRKRQAQAAVRFGRIIKIMVRNRWAGHEWGIRAKIARELGVSRATICRDLQHLQRSLRDSEYAEEWLRFYRYDRRTYGGCFGPHPGAEFPQMDHSEKRVLRIALGLGKQDTGHSPRKVRESREFSCEPDEQLSRQLASSPVQPEENPAPVIETDPPDRYSVHVASPCIHPGRSNAETRQHQSRQ